jgi:hypothetical protein
MNDDHALRQLTAQAAPHLGTGWQQDQTQTAHHRADLTHPDGRRLILRTERRRPGRAIVTGAYPDNHVQLGRRSEYPEITFRIDRGPAALAREIAHRFLPRYEPLLAEIRDQLRAAAEAAQAREELAERIIALVPDARRAATSSPSRTIVEWYGHQNSAHGTGTVEIHDAATLVSIRISYLAGPVTERILTALTGNQR